MSPGQYRPIKREFLRTWPTLDHAYYQEGEREALPVALQHLPEEFAQQLEKMRAAAHYLQLGIVSRRAEVNRLTDHTKRKELLQTHADETETEYNATLDSIVGTLTDLMKRANKAQIQIETQRSGTEVISMQDDESTRVSAESLFRSAMALHGVDNFPSR